MYYETLKQSQLIFTPEKIADFKLEFEEEYSLTDMVTWIRPDSMQLTTALATFLLLTHFGFPLVKPIRTDSFTFALLVLDWVVIFLIDSILILSQSN